MFNNILFNGDKIDAMHDSMKRLYEFVAERGITQPSELARALNQSQQVVTNWETRGISRGGFLICQAALGVNAGWLETGLGSISLSAPHPAAPASSAQALPPTVDADAWKALTPKTRALIEELAQGGIADDDIKVLQAMADRMKKP